MVNMVDTDKLMRNSITQFCEQHFKFSHNLKIFGSIHVHADNNEVLTCLLDEKLYQPQHDSNILPNGNLFNHQQLMNLTNNTSSLNNDALNLVKTLTQLHQRNKMSSSLSNGGSKSSKSSSSSSSSSASSTSSTSYTSSVLNNESLQQDTSKHKRKRFEGTTNDSKQNGGTSDSNDASSSSSRTHNDITHNNDQNTDCEDEMNSEANIDGVNGLENGHHKHNNRDNNHDDDYYNGNNNNEPYSASETPYKRNKLEADHQDIKSSLNGHHDEAAQAAAGALSLFSAAAVASKLLNPSNNMNGFSNLNSQLLNLNGAELTEAQKLLLQQQKPEMKKRGRQKKIKIPHEFELEKSSTAATTDMISSDSGPQSKVINDTDQDSDSEKQLYMDEDNCSNENDMEKHGKTGANTSSTTINNNAQDLNQKMQAASHQQQILMAAAAALMNNSTTNGSFDPAQAQANMKLFMPQNLLTLAAQHNQDKQKSSIMSPSSSSTSSMTSCINVVSNGSTSSLKNGDSCSNKSSASSTTSSVSSKPGKGRRKTIASLAANSPNPVANLSLQNGNFAAFAAQYGIKDPGNLEQLFQEINDKSKMQAIQQAAAIAIANKVNKKKFASSSVQNTPDAKELAKLQAKALKSLKTKKDPNTFQDASNLLSSNPAAAAAMHYQQLISSHNLLNKQLGAAQKSDDGKEFEALGDSENADQYSNKYNDEEYRMKGENYDEDEMVRQNKAALSKSLNCTPLSQSNTNGNQPGLAMTPNLEFECSLCDKRFKYYCYYKRHVDACHSEWPKYICDTCNKSYKWEASFRQHLKSHHQTGSATGGAESAMAANSLQRESMTIGEAPEYGEELNEEMNDEPSENYMNNKGDTSLQNASMVNNEEDFRNESNIKDDEVDDKDRSDANYVGNNDMNGEDDIDSQEQDIEQQINQSQNEQQLSQPTTKEPSAKPFFNYDNDRIGAAGALASIAESLSSGRLMVNQQDGTA